jgi:hypothetical protein
MNEESLIMPDDFCLQKEEHISVVVSLGNSQAGEVVMPELTIEFSEPKMKQAPIKIENAEHTRRGATGGLF